MEMQTLNTIPQASEWAEWTRTCLRNHEKCRPLKRPVFLTQPGSHYSEGKRQHSDLIPSVASIFISSAAAAFVQEMLSPSCKGEFRTPAPSDFLSLAGGTRKDPGTSADHLVLRRSAPPFLLACLPWPQEEHAGRDWWARETAEEQEARDESASWVAAMARQPNPTSQRRAQEPSPRCRPNHRTTSCLVQPNRARVRSKSYLLEYTEVFWLMP